MRWTTLAAPLALTTLLGACASDPSSPVAAMLDLPAPEPLTATEQDQILALYNKAPGAALTPAEAATLRRAIDLWRLERQKLRAARQATR